MLIARRRQRAALASDYCRAGHEVCAVQLRLFFSRCKRVIACARSQIRWKCSACRPLPASPRVSRLSLPGGLTMLLQRAEYDAKTRRAYVEFRGRDGDAVATTIFSYQTTEQLSKGRLREEMVRMARHLLKRAAAAT